MPSDFEDEEIDEDEAFNSEDERKYGAWFERDAASGSSDNGQLMDSDSEPEGDEEPAASQLDGDEDDDLLSEDADPQGDPGQQVDALLDDVFGADASGSDEDDEDDEEMHPEQHAELVRAVQRRDAQPRVRDPNAHVLSEATKEGEFDAQPASGMCGRT